MNAMMVAFLAALGFAAGFAFCQYKFRTTPRGPDQFWSGLGAAAILLCLLALGAVIGEGFRQWL